MSFVFQIDNGFLLVDSKPRQGLFHQTYTKEGFSKASTLLPFPTTKYSATLDSNQTLHVVAENNKNQIFYISYDKGHISRRVVLEDPKQLYHFSDLHLFTTPQGSYIFYTVKHPTGNSRSLMWQSISANNPNIQTLISSIPDGGQVKFFPANDILHIIYTDFDEIYTLKLIRFSLLSSTVDSLLTSQIPIIDYNLCQTPSEMHLVILKDAYGQQQLSYFNVQTRTEQLLSIQLPATSPCIFSYCHFLWISYMSGDKLYILLSGQDHGHFSVSVPCSIQGYITTCTYIGKEHSILNSSTLPIQIGHHLRIAVVSSFDIIGLHPDLPLSSELDLLFDAMGFTYIPSYASPSQAPLPTPTPTPTPIIPSSPTTSSVSPPLTIETRFNPPQGPSHLTAPPLVQSSPPQQFPRRSTESIVPPITLTNTNSDGSLKSAARAFMGSSNGFELLPISKDT